MDKVAIVPIFFEYPASFSFLKQVRNGLATIFHLRHIDGKASRPSTPNPGMLHADAIETVDVTANHGIHKENCSVRSWKGNNVLIMYSVARPSRSFVSESKFSRLAVLGVNRGPQIILNTTSEDEHVPEIERTIRTVKERARCALSGTPFNKIPGVMTVCLIMASAFWLHAVGSHPDGMSSTQSPRQLVEGLSIPTTDSAIDRVHTLARRDPKGINFFDRNQMPLDDDDDDDSSYAPSQQFEMT